MTEIPAAEWANFFVAEVGASAALTGLVVVAISINLARILAYPHLPGRAAEALVLLGGVLVLSSLALVPHQPIAVFGIETLIIALAMLSAPIFIQLRSFRAKVMPRGNAIARSVIDVAPSIAIFIAGLLLLCSHANGLYWIAAGVILCLFAGVVSAWVLLVEIMR